MWSRPPSASLQRRDAPPQSRLRGRAGALPHVHRGRRLRRRGLRAVAALRLLRDALPSVEGMLQSATQQLTPFTQRPELLLTMRE